MMDGGGASLRGCGDGDETAFKKNEDLGNISCIRSGIETYVHYMLDTSALSGYMLLETKGSN